ncbi:MAG TPA: hypothetical protein VF796_21580, partial [Humisphaera sp.]
MLISTTVVIVAAAAGVGWYASRGHVIELQVPPIDVAAGPTAEVIAATETVDVQAEVVFREGAARLPRSAASAVVHFEGPTVAKARVKLSPTMQPTPHGIRVTPALDTFHVELSPPVRVELPGVASAKLGELSLGAGGDGIDAGIRLEVVRTLTTLLASRVLGSDAPASGPDAAAQDPAHAVVQLVESAAIRSATLALRPGAVVRTPSGPISVAAASTVVLSDVALAPATRELRGGFRVVLSAAPGTRLALGGHTAEVGRLVLHASGTYERTPTGEALRSAAPPATAPAGSGGGSTVRLADGTIRLSDDRGTIRVGESEWSVRSLAWTTATPGAGGATMVAHLVGGLRASLADVVIPRGTFSAGTVRADGASVEFRSDGGRRSLDVRLDQGAALQDWSVVQRMSAKDRLELAGESLPVGPLRFTDLDGVKLRTTRAEVGVRSLQVVAGPRRVDIGFAPGSTVNVNGGTALTVDLGARAGTPAFSGPLRVATTLPSATVADGDARLTLTGVASDLTVHPSPAGPRVAGTLSTGVAAADLRARLKPWAERLQLARAGAVTVDGYEVF